MNRSRLGLTVLISLLAPAIAFGADVSGSLLYDGLPVSDVFPDINQVVLRASPWDGGDEIDGTVDLATSTYSISGLETVRYDILVYLDRTPPINDVGNPGDLSAYGRVEPADAQDTLEQDLEILYHYHVVSPIDATADLDGMGLDCTAHPQVDYPITFAINPVPRATSYSYVVYYQACPDGGLGFDEFDTDQLSVEVSWGTFSEDYHQLAVRCLGESGAYLCAGTTYRYSDAHVWGLMLRNRDTTGRGTHRTDAVILPAVASAAGAQGTYWSSAVTVVNLLYSTRDVLVYYTPRGANGMNDYERTTITLPSNGQLAWDDVVDELFSTTGAGSLEIRGTGIAVTSRTSTPGGDGGSYGQGIPPLQPSQVLRADTTGAATVGGVQESSVFRTNLGLVETWGNNVTVRVTIYDSAMSQLGQRDYQLRPYENTQVNQVAKTITGLTTLTDGIARVEIVTGTGRVGAYLSVVDNATGDPTYIAIAPQTPAGG